MPVVPVSVTGVAETTIVPAVAGRRARILGFQFTSTGTAGKIVQIKSGGRVIHTFNAGIPVTIAPADQFTWSGMTFSGEALTITADDAATVYGGSLHYAPEDIDAPYATPMGLLFLITRQGW